MRKNCTFSNILQKVKNYFFANIYHSPFDIPIENSKKSLKLKPPNKHWTTDGSGVEGNGRGQL
jgi:hypothetical protein